MKINYALNIALKMCFEPVFLRGRSRSLTQSITNIWTSLFGLQIKHFSVVFIAGAKWPYSGYNTPTKIMLHWCFYFSAATIIVFWFVFHFTIIFSINFNIAITVILICVSTIWESTSSNGSTNKVYEILSTKHLCYNCNNQ